MYHYNHGHEVSELNLHNDTYCIHYFAPWEKIWCKYSGDIIKLI